MNLGKNDTDKDDFVDKKPYTQYDQLVTRRILHFYISSVIVGPEEYVEMFQRIQTAGPDDVVYIHLNTVGGYLHTGVQLINAMQSSAAHVVVSVEGNCHSCGTLIFLAADEFVVHDNCLMLFHNFSSGSYGKGNEQQVQLEAQIKWFNEMAYKFYIPFLSEDEVNRIIKGEDIWLDSDAIRKRLKTMVKSVIKTAKKVTKVKVKSKKKKVKKVVVEDSEE